MGANLLRLLSVLALGISLVSCGKDPNNYRVNSAGIPTYDFLTQSEAQKQYNTWQVKCLDPQKCPDSVGQLIVLTERSVSVCTATLISEDTVITNSHCFDIYDSNQRKISEEKVCAGGSSVVFATNSASGREQISCFKVLKKSLISRTALYSDYMILQLSKKSKRKSDPVVRLGMKDKEKLTLRKVNPKQRGLGELEVQDCEVLHRTAILPGASNKDFFVHVLKGCEMVQGNSGSSLVDKDSNVRGVVFAGIKETSTAQMDQFQKDVYAKAREVKTSLAANATCMEFDFPNQPGADIKKCSEHRAQAGDSSQMLDRSEFRRKLEMQMFEASGLIPEQLGYRLHHTLGSRVAYYVPSCLKVPSLNTADLFRDQSLRAPVLVWHAHYGVSDRLRPAITEITTTEETCALRWSLRDLIANGQTSVSMSGQFCYDSRGNQGARKDVWAPCDP